MDILAPIFWVIVIVIWIVSALAKKQAEVSRRESPEEEEGYRKPEETIERFLRRLTGEEEIKVTPPYKPLPVVEEAPPPPPKKVVPPRTEKAADKMKRPGVMKKVELPLLGTLDAFTIRRGIILSEILGPPRAEKPL